MKKIILALTASLTLFSSSSFAELAVGGYLGVNQSQPGNPEVGTYSGRQGTEFGAFVLFPFFPTLNFRLGLAQKVRKIHDEGKINLVGGGTVYDYTADITETLNDLSVGVQWDLPVTDLYLMGGAKVSSSQRITCDIQTPRISITNCDKTATDYPIFVGVGYNLFDWTPVHLAIEGEYERSSTADFQGAKNGALTGRLMFKFGL